MAGLEPILPTREIVGLEGGKKQFQKWHGIRIKMGACRSWSSRHFGISIALPLYFIVLGLLEKAFILNFNFYFLIFASTFMSKL